MTVNERSPVTELQVTACVFGSIYAFHLIRLSGRSNDVPFVQRFPLYDLPFCRYKALKPHTICFEISMIMNTIMNTNTKAHFAARCFSPFSAKRKFSLSNAFAKTPKLTYFAVKKCQLANLVANRDWLIIMTALQATACIFRQF